MKKLLILALVAMLTVTMAYSQDTTQPLDTDALLDQYTDDVTGEVDFEGLMSDPDVAANPTEVLPALIEPDPVTGETPIDNIDFSPILDPEGDGVDQETLDLITETLTDQGYDAEEIAATTDIVDALAAGDTISQVKDNPDLQFDLVEDAMAEAVATQIKGDLIDAETQEQLNSALNIVGLALEALNGFAQSTALNSNSSNLFGYQNYKIFTASLGMYGGFALPEPLDTTNALLDEVSRIDTLGEGADPIEEMKNFLVDNGIQAGFTGQAFSLSAGINLSWLIDDLYVGIVAGSTEMSMNDVDGAEILVLDIPVSTVPIDSIDPDGTTFQDIPSFDMSISSSVFGIRANYRLVEGFGIPVLFRWNGVSLGSGFIVNTMSTTADIDLSSLVNLSPGMLEASYSLDSSTFTIPLEASTGVQLLSILTLTAGAGVDVQFGSSSTKMDLAMDESTIAGKIVNKTIQSILQGDKDPETGEYNGLEFPVNQEGEVALFNPRVNAGIGLGIGPVVFDFSAFYYFNTGLGLGANFIIRI
jgi:hypothetical protein